jgi:hypothetical protein
MTTWIAPRFWCGAPFPIRPIAGWGSGDPRVRGPRRPDQRVTRLVRPDAPGGLVPRSRQDEVGLDAPRCAMTALMENSLDSMIIKDLGGIGN